MWENTVAIHNFFFKKKLQNQIINQLNMKKIEIDKDNYGKKQTKKTKKTI